MSWLSSLFGGGKDPMKEAQKYYGQIPGQMGKYLDPMYQRGERAAADLEQQYGQLAQDPTAALQNLMSGYQQSPGFQQEMKESLQAAANTAAAGGMLGSAADQRSQGDLAARLQQQDMQQYLKNVMGLQGLGLQGEQNLYGLGAQSGTNMAESLANLLGQQGSLAAQQAQQQNQLPWQLLGTLGGYALGGPAGGFGSQFGKWLFGGK